MRTLSRSLTATLVVVLSASLLACGGSQKKPTTAKKQEAPAFPKDYTSWHKVNAETIIREDEVDEGGGVARELYANMVGMLEAGTVLVKEQYAFANGAKGELQAIHVMRMTEAADNDGWQFLAFDPQGKALPPEAVARCVSCHSLQKDNAYLFSEIEALTAPAADGAGEPATEDGGAAEDGSAEGDGAE